MNAYRSERRRTRFRRRLVFHLLTYAVVVTLLVAVNAWLGGRWWSLGIAAVWGGFLLLRLVVAALVWRVVSRRIGGRTGAGPNLSSGV